MKHLKTDPAFKDLIPPLSDREFQGLEENILAQGRCLNTIKVWKGTIVDGHNRYAICQKHGIPYEVQEMRFPSRSEAKLWIIQNQLGRRNLISAMRIMLVLHKEALLKEKARQNRSGIQDAPVHTRKILANEAQASEQTVYRYMKIRELGPPELLRQVDTGQIKIGTAYHTLDTNSALEVTTRTVERYCNDEPPDISDPYCKRGVLGNIERLAKLFGFISDNAPLLQYEGDMQRVQGKLKSQLRQISAVIAGSDPQSS